MMEVKVTKTTNPKVKPDPATVPFGVAFTDHMFMMEYDSENGWQNPRIVPFGDISLNPGALVFHYGAEVFEGLKAYRTPSGEVQMFRPAENFKRMNNSAERLCLPPLHPPVPFSCVPQIPHDISSLRPWRTNPEKESAYAAGYQAHCHH